MACTHVACFSAETHFTLLSWRRALREVNVTSSLIAKNARCTKTREQGAWQLLSTCRSQAIDSKTIGARRKIPVVKRTPYVPYGAFRVI